MDTTVIVSNPNPIYMRTMGRYKWQTESTVQVQHSHMTGYLTTLQEVMKGASLAASCSPVARILV